MFFINRLYFRIGGCRSQSGKQLANPSKFSVNDVFEKLIGSVRKKEGLHEKIIVKEFKPYHIKHTCAITKVDNIIIVHPYLLH